MATWTADQVIGKTLVALKDVTAYYSFYPTLEKAKKFKISKGHPIGIAKGWIQKYSPDKKLWWMFIDKQGLYYFVKNDYDKVGMGKYDSSTIQSQEEKIKAEKDKKEKDEKGEFIYYAEKWGKKIVIGAAVIYVGVNLLKLYNENQRSKSTTK